MTLATWRGARECRFPAAAERLAERYPINRDRHHAGRLCLLDSEQLLLRHQHRQVWRDAGDLLLSCEVQCKMVLGHGPLQRAVASRQRWRDRRCVMRNPGWRRIIIGAGLSRRPCLRRSLRTGY
jgi:hypothetical protein